MFIELQVCNLRKQSRFRDASTGFPAKWRLRNELKKSILLRCHCLHMSNSSDLLKQISHTARPVTEKHYLDLGSGTSSVLNFCALSWSFHVQTSGSGTKFRLFSQTNKNAVFKEMQECYWFNIFSLFVIVVIFKYPCLQNFLFKCLGVVLNKVKNQGFVQNHLNIMFSNVKHASQVEREVK